MNTRYDVAILGCGEAGIFAGYELMHRNPNLKVVALTEGDQVTIEYLEGDPVCTVTGLE